MPLWLDLLRTPMAAPETAILRRMRYTWQALCLTSAGATGLFSSIHHIAGRMATIAIALLLIVTLLWTALYLGLKQRADRAFLKAMGGGE